MCSSPPTPAARARLPRQLHLPGGGPRRLHERHDHAAAVVGGGEREALLSHRPAAHRPEFENLKNFKNFKKLKN